MKAKTEDLRTKTKEIIETIIRGEEVLLTYRGKDLAKIIPLKKKSPTSRTEIPEIFGMWRDHQETKDPLKYVRNLRKGRF